MYKYKKSEWRNIAWGVLQKLETILFQLTVAVSMLIFDAFVSLSVHYKHMPAAMEISG